MLSKIKWRKSQKTEATLPKPASTEPLQHAPESHELYEQIARGHALAEVEERARRRWQGG